MRIGVATDHGGFGLEQELVAQLRAAGHEVIDFGADRLSPDDDYPDFVTPLADAVASGQVERDVAICGRWHRGIGVRQQDSRRPCRADPRSFLGPAGRRGRSHERSLHGWPHSGTRSGLGPRSDLLGRRIQSSRTRHLRRLVKVTFLEATRRAQ